MGTVGSPTHFRFHEEQRSYFSLLKIDIDKFLVVDQEHSPGVCRYRIELSVVYQIKLALDGTELMS